MSCALLTFFFNKDKLCSQNTLSLHAKSQTFSTLFLVSSTNKSQPKLSFQASPEMVLEPHSRQLVLIPSCCQLKTRRPGPSQCSAQRIATPAHIPIYQRVTHDCQSSKTLTSWSFPLAANGLPLVPYTPGPGFEKNPPIRTPTVRRKWLWD